MPGRTLPNFLSDEVAAHNTKDSCYVTIGSDVYDVTSFINDHPGGGELVLEYAGKDVEKIMKDELSHEHSDSAYEILKDCRVGFVTTQSIMKVVADSSAPDQILPLPPTASGNAELAQNGVQEDMPSRPLYEATGLSTAEDLSKDTDAVSDYKSHKFLDLNKPLFLQMLFSDFSKDFYLEQVHRPRHYKGGASAPLFGNFLEPLSLTPWWVVPLVWLPPVAYGTALGFMNLWPLEAASYWCLGLFLWTLVEYVLHRFLFHLDYYLPDHPVALTAHFLLHGIHHYLPMDRYRLVMPPAMFLLLATPFWKLAHTVFFYNWYAATAVYSGGIFGYICYDMSHYFLHHRTLPEYWRELKKYHLAHHYQNFELGFGVTSKFWDRIFGTELQYAKPIKTT